MSRKIYFPFVLCFTLFAISASAQTTSGKDSEKSAKPVISSTPDKSTLEGRIEHYLRCSYGWGDTYGVKVGPAKPSLMPDLLAVPVTVTMAGQSDTAVVYVDKKGRFILRGELADMNVDPLANIRSKLIPGNSPATGPKDAKITLIEFADFECPSCRQLDLILRDLLATRPDIRLVYKNFPLTNLHPWAMTAAIAGQCTFQQNPEAFWKIHNEIFDAQDVISPSNVWDKMVDFAAQLGLDPQAFRSCMADPATAKIIAQSQAEGHALDVSATPTTFVNGRRVVGPDEALLKQFIQAGIAIY
jgi:protein-disulfide isomerase